jgi:hypothetical protein
VDRDERRDQIPGQTHAFFGCVQPRRKQSAVSTDVGIDSRAMSAQMISLVE